MYMYAPGSWVKNERNPYPGDICRIVGRKIGSEMMVVVVEKAGVVGRPENALRLAHPSALRKIREN